MELKKCPFCNGEAIVTGGAEDWSPSFRDPDSGGIPYQIRCMECLSSGGHFYELDDAIKAWNRRGCGGGNEVRKFAKTIRE